MSYKKPSTSSTGGEENDLGIKKRHVLDKDRQSQKRIIICCDGTWQSAVSGENNVPSNITRLCRAINPVGSDASGEVWEQIVWYDSGVGTTSLPLSTTYEGATGQGLEGNVIEAYNFCVLNYTPGDQIMVFGFSRGAYTARTIAGVITDIGICKKTDLNRFPDLWKQYKTFKHEKTNKGKRFFRSKAWFEWMWEQTETQGRVVRDMKSIEADWAQPNSRTVEVVGVYDTVGAIGMPEVFGQTVPMIVKRENEWHNVGLSTHIKHAFQALAFNERRKAFKPSLFYIPPKPNNAGKTQADDKDAVGGARKAYSDLSEITKSPSPAEVKDAGSRLNDALRRRMNHENKMKDPTKLLQVWFPGYHIHIGGGSSDTMQNKDNMEEMSNIAYAWMLDQVKKHLSLNEEHIMQEYTDRENNFKLQNRKFKDWKKNPESWKDWAWRRSSQVVSAVTHPLTPGPVPLFTEERFYDWGTGKMEDSYSEMYRINGQHVRTPGLYAFNEKGESLGDTCEYIHPVGQYRAEQAGKATINIGPLGPIFSRKLAPQDKNKKKEDQEPRYVWDLTYPPDPKLPSDVRLKEWPLGGPDCYERKAIIGPRAQKWVKSLDNMK
ncbi:hypothetical protein N7466_002867 [Penicillium verhagenii]|uniref:uncharacterized protein n=1 Tax=Penicillium verhagenii TaxID=1562060 RepID=UPI00254584CC|nr:uncharacterized protein N7466_002867 [Penicillium verhagenii]KAJ5939733.1 hypothetical protein N7466_002867 [Penicillium verhagenii]